MDIGGCETHWDIFTIVVLLGEMAIFIGNVTVFVKEIVQLNWLLEEALLFLVAVIIIIKFFDYYFSVKKTAHKKK